MIYKICKNHKKWSKTAARRAVLIFQTGFSQPVDPEFWIFLAKDNLRKKICPQSPCLPSQVAHSLQNVICKILKFPEILFYVYVQIEDRLEKPQSKRQQAQIISRRKKAHMNSSKQHLIIIRDSSEMIINGTHAHHGRATRAHFSCCFQCLHEDVECISTTSTKAQRKKLRAYACLHLAFIQTSLAFELSIYWQNASLLV